jgi:invasion protein IalB
MEGNLLGFILRPKAIAVAVAALAMLPAVAPSSAQAQQNPAQQGKPAVSETYDSWGLTCSTPKACQIQVVLANKETNKFVAALVYTKNGQNQVMMGVIPLGLLLGDNPSLQVDSGTAVPGRYVQCISSGCRISIPVDDALVQQMKRGSKAVLTAMAPGNKPFTLNFDLKGFADAETALESKIQ